MPWQRQSEMRQSKKCFHLKSQYTKNVYLYAHRIKISLTTVYISLFGFNIKFPALTFTFLYRGDIHRFIAARDINFIDSHTLKPVERVSETNGWKKCNI